MKNSLNPHLHKFNEQGLKLEGTYPKRKRQKKTIIKCKNSKSKPQKPENTPPDEKQLVPNTTRMVSKTHKETMQAPLVPR